MAKIAGKAIRFDVSTDGGTTWNAVKGQDNLSFSVSSATVDASDKTSGSWGSTLAGVKSMTVNLSGKVDLPDTTGLDVLRTASLSESANSVLGRVILNVAADSYYEGNFTVSEAGGSGALTDAAQYTFTLNNDGAVTFEAGA